MVLHYSGNALLRLWLTVLSSHGVHYFVKPWTFPICAGHQLNCYWHLGWTYLLCVLVCMTASVWVVGKRIVLLCHIVLVCGYVCGCLLLFPDRFGRVDSVGTVGCLFIYFKLWLFLHWIYFDIMHPQSFFGPHLSQSGGPYDVACLNFVWYILC